MSIWFQNKYSPDTILKIKIKKTLCNQQSDFQKIEIIDTHEFGRMLVLDGIVNVTEKDEFIYHEMMVHVPAFTHPNPKDVLVIGGGDGGVVRELLKHSQVKRIDLVEIDPLVVDISKKYLPGVSSGLREPRLNIFFEDGTNFLKNKKNIYDLIIIDSPDPVGAGKKLFHEIFYNNCFNALKKDGLLTAQSETPEFKKELRIMKSMYKKFKKIFPVVRTFTACVPSYTIGIWCFAFCSKKYDPIDDLQLSRYRKQKIITYYYNADVHRSCFALPNYLKEAF